VGAALVVVGPGGSAGKKLKTGSCVGGNDVGMGPRYGGGMFAAGEPSSDDIASSSASVGACVVRRRTGSMPAGPSCSEGGATLSDEVSVRLSSVTVEPVADTGMLGASVACVGAFTCAGTGTRVACEAAGCATPSSSVAAVVDRAAGLCLSARSGSGGGVGSAIMGAGAGGLAARR
jgi:hypothetical protein